MVVILLSNGYVRFVSGQNGKVEQSYTINDSYGCLLNGIIMNEEGLKNLIKQGFDTYNLEKKDVHLVIDGNQISTKVMSVPKQKDELMLEYAKREFNDVERIEDPIYAFREIKRTDKNLVEVLGMVASRSYIKKFNDIFQSLNTKLVSVQTSMDVLLEFISSVDEWKDLSTIIQVVDGQSLYNVILGQGNHLYSSRTRLFSEINSEEYAFEIARSVNGLNQFINSQRIGNIHTIYPVGLPSHLQELYKANAGRFEIKEIEIENSQLALCQGALASKKCKTDLLTQSLFDKEKQERRKELKALYMPSLITLIILGIVTCGVLGNYYMKKRELNQILSFNNSPEVVEVCTKYDLLSNEIKTYSNLTMSMQNLERVVNAYPDVTTTTKAIVEQCAKGIVDIVISEYDSLNGAIIFKTSAPDFELINQFIDQLKQQSIFASVIYTGYTRDSHNNWIVKVNCTLAPEN